MNNIRRGDQVKIIAGKDRGRTSVVNKVLPGGDKLIVDGVNMVKKHQKANPQQNKSGSIIDKEMPIHKSNVMLVNPTTDKATKVGFKLLEDGRKVRYYKDNGEIVDVKA